MRRRRADESIIPLSATALVELGQLSQDVERWALENLDQLRSSQPVNSTGLINRSFDNWFPLLAIADQAGGHWPELARKACSTLSSGAEDQSAGVRLLQEIRGVFESSGRDRISSDELCRAIQELDDRRYQDDQELTKRRLAVALKPFGIGPNVFRDGNRTPRGYTRAQFEDAFVRYLAAAPVRSATAQHTSFSAELSTV